MMTMVLMMMGGLVMDLGGIMVMAVPILISPSCFSYVPPGWVRPGIHQTTNHDDHGSYDDGGHNGNGDDDDGGHHDNGDDDGDGKGDGRSWSQSGVWSGTSGGIMVMVVPILISPSCFSYVPSGWVRPGIHQTINHDDHGAHDDDGWFGQ
ncbi:MAG: hypothetical protein GY841_20675, partial [FCB group bacterium]|nr:hypothetical protein [FCB group bacterium]